MPLQGDIIIGLVFRRALPCVDVYCPFRANNGEMAIWQMEWTEMTWGYNPNPDKPEPKELLLNKYEIRIPKLETNSKFK
jgi:tmRNA-binding protein